MKRETRATRDQRQRMEGVQLRWRARWIAEGEKITKYFCGLQKLEGEITLAEASFALKNMKNNKRPGPWLQLGSFFAKPLNDSFMGTYYDHRKRE